jgi:hypothetical protein
MIEMKETYVNQTEGYQFGESEWFKPFTDDLGQLYRSLVKEYGRCISKVYVDQLQVNGRMTAVHVGWCFLKRMKYEDAKETYLREVWVHVRNAETKEEGI